MIKSFVFQVREGKWVCEQQTDKPLPQPVIRANEETFPTFDALIAEGNAKLKGTLQEGTSDC